MPRLPALLQQLQLALMSRAQLRHRWRHASSLRRAKHSWR